ncbi:energy transducer TonB [Sphingomonas mesophila]|uniref:energy transducer TonB n=1 Tax=Sphingomonas mesophila TaxID=2303576 RepID=UPI000E595857|nr:energy transducer TonB [Sphingomonas mesophila]
MRILLLSAALVAAPLSAQTALFSADDYPAEAVRKQEEGVVQVKLRISPEGRVTECSIVKSASRALDVATCRLMVSRARFQPATDDAGRPIEAEIVAPPITWELGALKRKKDPRDARGLRL